MDNPAKPIGKFILSGVAVFVGVIVVYLAVVLQVYILAWIVALLGKIFG